MLNKPRVLFAITLFLALAASIVLKVPKETPHGAIILFTMCQVGIIAWAFIGLCIGRNPFRRRQ